MGARRGQRWWWGGAGAAGLVAAACVSVALGLVAGIPLFDGLSPPPLYRWVHPPAPLAPENTSPDSLSAGVPLTPGGSPAKDVVTGDDQVLVQLPQGAFASTPGQSSVQIDITPVDPATVPALPPGMTVQGNVYRITAVYEPSGATASAVSPFAVQLRYPVDATMVAYNPGNGWQLLSTIPESAYLEVLGQLGQGVTGSGLFAAVLTGVAPVKPARVPSWAFAAIGVALVLAGLPALLARRRPRAASPPETPGPPGS